MKEQYMRIKQAKIQHYALAVSVHTKKPRMVCLRGCAAGVGAAVSVMEQADVGHRHCDAVFVAGLDDVVVADGAAALRDVGDAALMRALDVVAEREEGV